MFSYVLLLVCDTKIASVRSVVQSSSSNLLSIRSVPSQIYATILHSIIFILSNSFVCFILHLDHLTVPFFVFCYFHSHSIIRSSFRSKVFAVGKAMAAQMFSEPGPAREPPKAAPEAKGAKRRGLGPAVSDAHEGSPRRKTCRKLEVQNSIGEAEALTMVGKLGQTVLPARQLRSMGGLTELAAEHYANFKKLLGPTSRPIGPKRHLTFASACSGSAQDLVVLNVVKQALKEAIGPGFTYEYVFACEVVPWKRRWIQMVMESMLDEDGAAPAPGGPGGGPCCFGDILKLPDGNCSCFNHKSGGQMKECPVRGMDVLIVSTSCKDFSCMNNTKHTHTILDGPDTKGGSVQHVRALCKLLETHRPDIIIYENVTELMDTKPDGSDLDIILQRWDRLGYETTVIKGQSTVYGLSAVRARLYLIAIQTRQPRVLSFQERKPQSVWDTFRKLLPQCHRKPECASKYVLEDNDPVVSRELEKINNSPAKQKETDKGFKFEQCVAIATKAGVEWGSFPPPKLLADSPWYNHLSNLQKYSLAYSLKVDPAKVFFRDVRQNFGRTRLSSRNESGEVIASTILPNQQLMIFFDEESVPNRTPRLMTGHENLWMQGFPIDIIKSMSDSDFTSSNLTELAGNMVSVPVTLALVTSLFASVPWIIDGHSNPAGPARDDSHTCAQVKLHEPLVEQEDQNPEVHEPLVEQEDQSPERTQVGAARPEEESPDFSDLLSAFEPGPGQGNVHGSDFMGFVPNQAPGRCQTEGLMHGPLDFFTALNHTEAGGLRHIPSACNDAHMFIEEGYWDACTDGPKPDWGPEWAFVGGQQRKGWWKKF